MSDEDALPRHAARVTLRRLRAADLAAFQAYRRDAELGRYQGWTPQSDADALAFIEAMAALPLLPHGQWMQLAIAARDTDALIGDIGICLGATGRGAEIGFTLARPLHGRGLALEALQALCELLRERTAVRRLVAITDARNAASIALLERLGMARLASADAIFRGEPCVEHRYELDLRGAEGGRAEWLSPEL